VNLINPPAMDLFEPSAYPSLGLLYLAAVLKKAGHKCTYIDFSEGLEVNDGVIPDIPQGINLITVLQATYKSSLDTAKFLRDTGNGPIVIGGSQVSLIPDKAVRDFNSYAAVLGEAENVIVDVVNGNKAGIVYGGVIEDLDSIPYPDRDILPLSKLRNLSGIHLDRYDNDGAATTMISSRGCPYSCAFCSKSPHTKYFRWRSAKNIIGEMLNIWSEYAINHIRFVDDCFTANTRRVFDLCSLLKPCNFYWLCITRADRVNANLLKEMYAAGCREIHFGIESGSQRILDFMNKGETVEQYVKAISLAKRAGLIVKIFLMEKFPGETSADIELTKEFVRRVQPDKFTLSKFVPLAGSQMSWTGEDYQFFYPEEETELRFWLRSREWERK